MAASELMSPEEIKELTDAAQAAKQAEWLADHGIPHKLVGRRVKLSRVHVRQWLEGARFAFSSGVNLGAVR
jgi:hypothetical protein